MKEFKITSDSITLETAKDEVENRAIGALSVFEGVVRDNNDGHQVRKLEYEC